MGIQYVFISRIFICLWYSFGGGILHDLFRTSVLGVGLMSILIPSIFALSFPSATPP